MSEEKKELSIEELNDDKRELTQEELEQVSGGARPLYIVDGVSMADDLGGINPADIGGSAVLKEAASASIYGSKAGN